MGESLLGGAVRFAPDVVVQVIDGEALVLHLRSESVYALDPAGARVAALIEQGLTNAEVVSALAREFDADAGDIARDVKALLDDLSAHGLIVQHPPPA